MAKIKTAIQFGLVYIPVVLHSCTKNTDIGFNMLYKKTGQRIRYKKTCENCPAAISPQDIVKGYQFQRDQYVILTDEELAKLKSKRDENIEILQFSALDEIDPILFEDSYYVQPTGAQNAYALLTKALAAEKKVGIAKAVLGQSETLLAVREIGGSLVMSKLHFADEIVENPMLEKAKEKNVKAGTVKKEELELAKRLVESMTKSFEITDYKNEYKERLKKAIESKIAGQKIQVAKRAQPKSISNLMDALRASIRQNNNSKDDNFDEEDEDDEEQKIVPINKKLKKRA